MRIGLRVKFMLSHSLPILLLLPLLGFYLFFNLRDLYFGLVEEDLFRWGTILADTLQVDPELANDVGRLQQILRLTDTQFPPHVRAIGKDGAILASTESSDEQIIGTVSQDPAVRTALQGQSWRGNDPNTQSDAVTVAIPVSTSGRVGAILLSLSLTDIQETFSRLQFLIVSATLGFSALGLILGGILGSTVARRLLNLAQGTKSIVSGDYSCRVKVDTRDELGDLAANFNTMAEQLSEQRTAREQLLDDLAHELRGPISALQVALEFIRRGLSEQADSVTLLFDDVEQEMSRLGRLTKRLSLAVLDRSASVSLDRGPLDVAAIAQRSVVLFAPELEKNGIKLVSDLPPELPLIAANADALTEVITNLIENAEKFTPAGGQVKVSGGRDGQKVWIQVADTGMGLTVDEQAKLFQRFYRGDPARPRPRGIGLGLAISNELVRLHEGTIFVRSEVNRGTTFRVELPG